MTPTALSTDRLAALVASKLDLLSLLVRLAQEQLALIAAEELEMVTRLLATKRSLLAQLVQVERHLDPFRADDPEARFWRVPEDRAACRRQAELGAQKLVELLALEKKAECELVRRQDAAIRNHNVHSATDASRAYAACFGNRACGLALCDEG